MLFSQLNIFYASLFIFAKNHKSGKSYIEKSTKNETFNWIIIWHDACFNINRER